MPRYMNILISWLAILVNTSYLVFFQDFVPPKKPFKRMPYTDAIEYLKEHKIHKDDDSTYEFGEVSILFQCKLLNTDF